MLINLISLKPTLYICNIDEKSVVKGNVLSEKVKDTAKKELKNCIVISASIESQIAEFNNEEEKR